VPPDPKGTIRYPGFSLKCFGLEIRAPPQAREEYSQLRGFGSSGWS
jgi:hypothetical protein